MRSWRQIGYTFVKAPRFSRDHINFTLKPYISSEVCCVCVVPVPRENTQTFKLKTYIPVPRTDERVSTLINPVESASNFENNCFNCRSSRTVRAAAVAARNSV